MTTAKLFRLAAPLLGLCLAAPALADSKGGGGNTALDNCAQQADIAWIQAQGMCPTGPDYMLQACLNKAAMDHAAALIACVHDNSAAIISGGTRKSATIGALRQAPRGTRTSPELGASSSMSGVSTVPRGQGLHIGRR